MAICVFANALKLPTQEPMAEFRDVISTSRMELETKFVDLQVHPKS